MTEPPPPPQQPPPQQPPPQQPPPQQPVPGQPPQQPPAPGGQPPGWTPPPGGYAAAPQTDGLAIGALACAIGAFLFCPVIPAIVALVLAHNSDQKIKTSGGRLTGEGLNTAARIVSWIHLGLFAFGVVIIIIIAAAGGFDTDDDVDFDSIGVGLQYLAARSGV